MIRAVSNWLLISALCGSAPALGVGLPAITVMGVAGSAMHCGPMCGPIVGGLAGEQRACKPTRLALLPYHAGRLATYTMLGALSGGLGAALPWFAWVRGAGLLLAAIVLATIAVRRLRGSPATLRRRASKGAGTLARLARRIDRRNNAGLALLGLLLGLLPCGFLYGALTLAAIAGGPASGAAVMLAFGLGTVPLLAAIGAMSALPAWRRPLAAAAPWLLLAEAGLLGGAALFS